MCLGGKHSVLGPVAAGLGGSTLPSLEDQLIAGISTCLSEDVCTPLHIV